MTVLGVGRVQLPDRAANLREPDIVVGPDRDPLRPSRIRQVLRVGHDRAWVRWVNHADGAATLCKPELPAGGRDLRGLSQ